MKQSKIPNIQLQYIKKNQNIIAKAMLLVFLIPSVINIYFKKVTNNQKIKNIRQTLQKDIAKQMEALAIMRKMNLHYSQLHELYALQQIDFNINTGINKNGAEIDAIQHELLILDEQLDYVLSHGSDGVFTECSNLEKLQVLHTQNHDELCELNKQTNALLIKISESQNDLLNQQSRFIASCTQYRSIFSTGKDGLTATVKKHAHISIIK